MLVRVTEQSERADSSFFPMIELSPSTQGAVKRDP